MTQDDQNSILDGTTTPNNCETEPVHQPGCCFAHGVLLVVDARTLEPLRVSANCAEFGFPRPEELFAASLEELLELQDGSLSQVLKNDTFTTATEWIGVVSTGEQDLDLHVHTLNGLLYLELEPVTRPLPRLETKLRQLLSNLDSIDDCKHFCECVSKGVQTLTGLDRVMVYRFGQDWSGEVIAEAVGENQEIRFLGLRFPPMDIPKPARDIYNNISVRVLPDAREQPCKLVSSKSSKNEKPLDMTYCNLRGASEMYTEYLDNMGVISSTTASLKREGKLWGMIACHHHQPFFLSPQTRAAFELLSQVASLQLDKMLTRETERLAGQRRSTCLELSELTIRNDCSDELLFEKMELLLDAEGVAYFRRGRFTGKGLCPTPFEWEQFLQEHLLSTEEKPPLIHCDRLREDYETCSWAKPIAGFFCLNLAPDLSECLVWFRQETLEEVHWGGDPSQKVIKQGKHGPRLHPRKSFEAYLETVAGRCKPWAEQEIYLGHRFLESRAEKLRQRASELESLNRALARANQDLDDFATIASHDLKEPLRGLANYAKFLDEDFGQLLNSEGKHMLERMHYLTDRMEGLLTNLLDYARLNSSNVTKAERPLSSLVTSAIQLLEGRVQERKAQIEIQEELPSIFGYPSFIVEILTNLISNSLKYTRRENPRIEISGWKEKDGRTTFVVKDDGIGIPLDKQDIIFELLVRLYPSDHEEFGEGFGIGLTVVRKMVERHNGEIVVTSALGEGAEFQITI